jgi:hypothetical protein
MKYFILSLCAFAALLLTSCKRDYTCRCNTETPGQYTYYTIQNTSRTDAKHKCEVVEECPVGPTPCQLQ